MKIVTLGQDLSDRAGYFALRKTTFFVFADKIWRKEERRNVFFAIFAMFPCEVPSAPQEADIRRMRKAFEDIVPSL